MPFRSNALDMLHGPLAVPMLRFALPLALTGILQQLFNTVDLLVVGRFLGTNALAAVGNGAPIVSLLVNLFLGISLGANVIIAQSLGASRAKDTTQAVHSAVLIAFASGFLLTALAEITAAPLLSLLQVPPEVLPAATLYLRVFLLGMPALAVFNFIAAIFRSRGDTQTPLFVLVVSNIANLAINLFAVSFSWDLAGIACGTVCAHFLGAFLMLRALRRRHGILRLHFGAIFRLHPELAARILRIGIPAGIQGALFCIANIVIQGYINSLGPVVMAASAAGLVLELNFYVFVLAFGQTVTTFVGQNYGAGNLARCRAATMRGLQMGLVFTALISFVVCSFAEPILRFIDGNPDIVEPGLIRIYFTFIPYVTYLVIEIFSGALRGYGASFPPALLMLFTICGLRLLWLSVAFPYAPNFMTISACYPLSWSATAVALYVLYRWHQRRFR